MKPTAKTPGQSTISPTALARIHTCAHYWYLQCFEDKSLTVPPDAGAQMRMDVGKEFEKEVIATMQVVQPDYPEGKPWEGVEPTLELMRKGTPLIYQGALKSDRILGLPDLLEKINEKSKLGAHSYQPVDIKSHAKVSKKDKLQLAAYALMLEESLGYLPTRGVIILKNRKREEVDFNDELDEIRAAMKRAQQVERKELATLPLRCGECNVCPWTAYCETTRVEKKLVTVISGIGSGLTQQLIDAGIDTFDKLAKLTPDKIVKDFGIKLEKASDVHINAKAWSLKRPLVKNKIKLPTSKKTIIHYDIETYGENLYLHGLIVEKNGLVETKQFVARKIEKEETTLEEFLAFVESHGEAIIYTWTDFENGWIKDMAERYPKLKKRLHALLERFHDLKEIVKDALALPVTTFGIKEVAPVFDFQWRAEDAGGGNSEAWYKEWLATGDERVLRKILQYNEDDVRAMQVIFLELRNYTK